jgi:hypothetical protein
LDGPVIPVCTGATVLEDKVLERIAVLETKISSLKDYAEKMDNRLWKTIAGAGALSASVMYQYLTKDVM